MIPATSRDRSASRTIDLLIAKYDMPPHDVIEMSPLFGTPTYRWLRAKGKIESHFVAFYTHVPEGFNKIDDVRLDNGQIVVEDRGSHKQVTLTTSRGLSLSE